MSKRDDIATLPAEVESETIESINRLADAAALRVEGTSVEMALYRAEIAYLCDPHLRSVDFFWQMMDGQVSLIEFQVHARERRWEAMRLKVRQKAQADLVRRLSKQIVSEQLQEASDMQKLRRWFFRLLTPREIIGEDGEEDLQFKVAPNSLEGVVKAYKDITTLLQMYRSDVLATLQPMVPELDVESEEDIGPFTESEAGEMARAILAKRLKIRQQLPAHDDLEED